MRVLDYARLIAQQAGLDIEPVIPGVYRFGDPRYVFSDVGKLKSLGWSVNVDFQRIVNEYIEWGAEPE